MDNSLHTQLDNPTLNPLDAGASDERIGWLPRPVSGLRMLDDDDDDWVDGDELDDDDFDDDDDWGDEDELEDDDFDDDFDDEDDFDDDDDDEYEYEYRGDPGWDREDVYDEYDLLGTRFASLLEDPPAGPKRFRDREGMPRGDKRPKDSRRRRVTRRPHDEIENDDD